MELEFILETDGERWKQGGRILRKDETAEVMLFGTYQPWVTGWYGGVAVKG